MTFNDEILRPDSDAYVCLEIETGSTTLRYANRPVEEPGIVWEALIQNQSLNISRSMDPETQQISLSAVTVSLDNRIEENDIAYFSSLLESGVVIENKPGHLYLKFKRDCEWCSEMVFSGLCVPGVEDDEKFTLTISSNLDKKLGILQRQANEIDYPGIPEGSNGKGLNLILGESSNGTTGTVQLTLVNENVGSGTAKLIVAQHRIKSVDELFRFRSNTYTQLTAGFSQNTNDTDDRGRPVASISITTGHQKGDVYFADVKGFPGEGYVALSGSNYLKRDAGDLVDMDFGSDPFTVEVAFTPGRDGVTESLISHYGGGGDRGWMFLRGADGKIRFYVSSDGTTVISCVGPTVLNSGAKHIARAAITPGVGIEIDVNGTTQALTWSDNMPDNLYSPSAALNVGAYLNGGAPFQGTVHYAVIAKGAQPGNNYKQDALEDIISEWRFTHDGSDLQGTNDLINSGSPTFTCLNHEKNPAFTFRQVLLQHEGVTSLDIDETSIVAAAGVCSDLGLDGVGVHGGIIPKSGGQVENSSDRTAVLQELARNFGYALVPQASGKVGLKRIAVDESQEETVHYKDEDKDFLNAIIQITHKPLNRCNEVRALLQHSHAISGNHEGYLRGYNQLSQETYQKSEQQWSYSYHRDIQVLEAVLGPRISLRSGRTKLVQFTVPGFKGLQAGSDVGDIVKVTAPSIFGNFVARKILLTSKTVDLINGGVQFGGLTLGDQVGSVAFSSEQTTLIQAVTSTFIGASENPVPGLNFEDANAAAGYGDKNYLRHGHHYSQTQIAGATGNINWRTLIRLNLDSAWATRSIRNVSVVLIVTEIPSLLYNYYFEHIPPLPGDSPIYVYRSNWSGVNLCAFNNDSWGGSTSYNAASFDANCGSVIGNLVSGMGSRTVTLNSSGVALFRNAAIGNGQGAAGRDVNLCLGNLGGGDYTSSCKLSKTIEVVITYMT